jgi:hypothetical protein
MLRLDDESRRARSKAQGAHLSQSRRTDFPAAARYLALARGIVAGELVYGLVEKTPKLGQVEWYSQHVVMQEGGNTVFRRRD